ncbi:hypothetical protein [Rhodoferax sp.]|uniref:hypothetical protein n=1 Tax=Rhodoferax sp. TaxID=50421 RepID=UPI0025D75759|nr:hypothetical protein [Rhodoferax sp.]
MRGEKHQTRVLAFDQLARAGQAAAFCGVTLTRAFVAKVFSSRANGFAPLCEGSKYSCNRESLVCAQLALEMLNMDVTPAARPKVLFGAGRGFA